MGFQNGSYLHCKPASGNAVPPSGVCKSQQRWWRAPTQPRHPHQPRRRCWPLPASRAEPQTFLSAADTPAAILGNPLCLVVTVLNASGVLAVHHCSRSYMGGEKKKRKEEKNLQSSKEPTAHGQSPSPAGPRGGRDHACCSWREMGFLSTQG